MLQYSHGGGCGSGVELRLRLRCGFELVVRLGLMRGLGLVHWADKNKGPGSGGGQQNRPHGVKTQLRKSLWGW